MKSWLESLLIALSMYSAIPVKCLNWTEKNLRNAMVFFPLVGLLCGVGLWLVWLVCGLLHVSSVLFGVLAVASGVLITGGSVPERAFRQWKPLCIWQKRQQHCRRTEQHCWNV